MPITTSILISLNKVLFNLISLPLNILPKGLGFKKSLLTAVNLLGKNKASVRNIMAMLRGEHESQR
jgi:hypothetical protein